MGKVAWDGPKWGRECLFPANPDLADILDDMDLYFEIVNFIFFLDSKFLDFQVPRFPKSGPGWAGLGPWVGWTWAGLGPDGPSGPWQFPGAPREPSINGTFGDLG